MSMNAGRGFKHDAQWMRGQQPPRQSQAGMGSGRNDHVHGNNHNNSAAASDHPHHHHHQQNHHQQNQHTGSYYSQSSVYPYSASSSRGSPHSYSWASNSRPMSFMPAPSYMSDVSSHPVDHTQYMDMFAPTTPYPYDGYHSSSNFFTPLSSPLTGAGGDSLFWGQHKHPVMGSGYRTNDVPFFGSNNQYHRSDQGDQSIEAGMSDLSLERNGHPASNGLPSSGSEFSDFSTEQELPATEYPNRRSENSSGSYSHGRKSNQSWASVASQPVRSSLRSKHSLSSRLIPAPNTDAIVAWDQPPKSAFGTAAEQQPCPVSNERPADPPHVLPASANPTKSVVPAESSSWVLMNDQPSPPLRLEIKSANQNVLPLNAATSRQNQDECESETNQRRPPVVAIRESKRDAFMGEERSERRVSDRQSDDSGYTINPVPDGKTKSGADRSAAPLKPVIDPSTLKDRQQLDHIFNPKEFDLNAPDAQFFVIKSYSEDDIHRSIKYSIWCSTERGNKRLDVAFRKAATAGGVIYLFFSVNGSGHFCGMAQMLSPLDYNSSANVWAQDKWKGQFKVRWIYVKDVPNAQLRHIRLENNENKPVTNSRDTQEVPPDKGRLVLSIFHSFKHCTSIFDDFLHYEQRQEEETHRRTDSSSHDTSSHPSPFRREPPPPRPRSEVQEHRPPDYHARDDRRHRVHDSRLGHDGRELADARRYNAHRDAYHEDQQQQQLQRHRSSYQRPQHRDGDYSRYDRNDHFFAGRQPVRRSDS